VLGEFTRESQTDGSLDLSRAEHSLVVVSYKAASLRGDLLERVVDERVQDRDRSLADPDLWMDLLEDSDDISRVRLDSLVMSLHNLLCGLGDFLNGNFFSNC